MSAAIERPGAEALAGASVHTEAEAEAQAEAEALSHTAGSSRAGVADLGKVASEGRSDGDGEGETGVGGDGELGAEEEDPADEAETLAQAQALGQAKAQDRSHSQSQSQRQRQRHGEDVRQSKRKREPEREGAGEGEGGDGDALIAEGREETGRAGKGRGRGRGEGLRAEEGAMSGGEEDDQSAGKATPEGETHAESKGEDTGHESPRTRSATQSAVASEAEAATDSRGEPKEGDHQTKRAGEGKEEEEEEEEGREEGREEGKEVGEQSQAMQSRASNADDAGQTTYTGETAGDAAPATSGFSSSPTGFSNGPLPATAVPAGAASASETEANNHAFSAQAVDSEQQSHHQQSHHHQQDSQQSGGGPGLSSGLAYRSGSGSGNRHEREVEVELRGFANGVEVSNEPRARQSLERFGPVLALAARPDRDCFTARLRSVRAADEAIAYFARADGKGEEEQNARVTYAPGEQERLGLGAEAAVPGQHTLKLFVGSVPRSAAEHDVRVVFEPFGELLEVFLLKDAATGLGKGCAFVTFAWKEDALAAIDAVNGRVQLKSALRPLEVRLAEAKRAGGHRSHPHSGGGSHPHPGGGSHQGGGGQGYHGGQSQGAYGMDNAGLGVSGANNLGGGAGGGVGGGGVNSGAGRVGGKMTKEEIEKANQMPRTVGNWKEYFSAEGRVYYYDETTKKTQWEQPESFKSLPPLGGWGAEANAAALGADLSGYQGGRGGLGGGRSGRGAGGYGATNARRDGLGGHSAYGSGAGAGPFGPVSASTTMGMGGMHGGGIGGGGGMGGGSNDQAGPPGANIFVFHVPNDWAYAQLVETFSPFGRIVSARIATDKMTGRNKGYAFVSYDNIVSAAQAVQTMHGAQIGPKRLKVSIKQNEEQYVQHLLSQPPGALGDVASGGNAYPARQHSQPGAVAGAGIAPATAGSGLMHQQPTHAAMQGMAAQSLAQTQTQSQTPNQTQPQNQYRSGLMPSHTGLAVDVLPHLQQHPNHQPQQLQHQQQGMYQQRIGVPGSSVVPQGYGMPGPAHAATHTHTHTHTQHTAQAQAQAQAQGHTGHAGYGGVPASGHDVSGQYQPAGYGGVDGGAGGEDARYAASQVYAPQYYSSQAPQAQGQTQAASQTAYQPQEYAVHQPARYAPY